MIRIGVDYAQARYIQGKLESLGKKTPITLKKAVNQSAKNIKSQLYKSVKEKYTIKRAVMGEKDFVIKNATTGSLTASIKLTGETPGLKKGYAIRKNGTQKAAQATIKKGGSMKPLEIAGLKAFVATMKNEKGESHTGIFQRTDRRYMLRGRVTDRGTDKHRTYGPRTLKNGKQTKGRQGIKELFGPGKGKIAEVTFQEEQEKAEEELRNQLNRFVHEALGGT